MAINIERFLPGILSNNLNSDRAGNLKAPTGSTANIDYSASSGKWTPPTGGIVPPNSAAVPTVFHSGQIGPVATTGLTQTQLVTTDTYFVEVFIPANTTITGISVLNGHTTNAGVSLNVGLANSAGTIVAKSATTTAQATADAYQQIPFTAPYAAVGPGKYYIAIQGSTTTGYIVTHAIGNFGATLKTTETYGTFVTTASYATTTFTTARGPVADTY